MIFTGRRYILLPLELFEEEQRKTIFYHSHIKKENETIRYDIVKENNLVVLYRIDTSAYKHLKQWDKNIIISSQISIFIEQLIDINSSSWSNMQFPCKFYSLFKEMITEDYYWLAEDSFVQSMIIKEEYT